MAGGGKAREQMTGKKEKAKFMETKRYGGGSSSSSSNKNRRGQGRGMAEWVVQKTNKRKKRGRRWRIGRGEGIRKRESPESGAAEENREKWEKRGKKRGKRQSSGEEVGRRTKRGWLVLVS